MKGALGALIVGFAPIEPHGWPDINLFYNCKSPIGNYGISRS
jgi:hypothetical protein